MKKGTLQTEAAKRLLRHAQARTLDLRGLVVLIALHQMRQGSVEPSVRDIAAQTSLPRSATSRALQRLVRHQLARRAANPHDERLVSFALTNRSTALLDALKRGLNQ